MLNGCTTLADYITRHQQDGVTWMAAQLLDKESMANPILMHDQVAKLAHIIALIPKEVARDEYAKKIGKEYGISFQTFKKVIESSIVIHKQTDKILVRKNKVNTIEGDACLWPFFMEVIAINAKNEEVFKGVEIDLEKFIALLASFGFTRYETTADSPGNQRDDQFAFVRLDGNVISSVSRQQIIDFIENFIRKDYNFEKFHYADSSVLLNKFYKQMKSLFSKDLFARVRTPEPIIINKDTPCKSFFYYRNGFVEVTAKGLELIPYDKLTGSVWDTQMLDRDFKLIPIDAVDENEEYPLGVFCDFCNKIAGNNIQRFNSLCTIIGYLVHDFYEYKLKAVLLTDSSLSEASEGRTGKTLFAKMLCNVRSYTEINGKDFDSGNKNKYEDVKLGTQLVHLNDVKTRGKYKFDFEDVFNDVTEGLVVNAKYMTPFRQFCKMIISTNKTLNIIGASQRDRIIEFEMSDFFGETRSPHEFYKQWFGRDWDAAEWHKFDNFICNCVKLFLKDGIVSPDSINLEARKLMNHTSMEFIEFMTELEASIASALNLPYEGYDRKLPHFSVAPITMFTEYPLDRRQLYDHFVKLNPDFNKWLTMNKFREWLHQYARLKHKIKTPIEKSHNGVRYIQFKETEK